MWFWRPRERFSMTELMWVRSVLGRLKCGFWLLRVRAQLSVYGGFNKHLRCYAESVLVTAANSYLRSKRISGLVARWDWVRFGAHRTRLSSQSVSYCTRSNPAGNPIIESDNYRPTSCYSLILGSIRLLDLLSTHSLKLVYVSNNRYWHKSLREFHFICKKSIVVDSCTFIVASDLSYAP